MMGNGQEGASLPSLSALKVCMCVFVRSVFAPVFDGDFTPTFAHDGTADATIGFREKLVVLLPSHTNIR